MDCEYNCAEEVLCDVFGCCNTAAYYIDFYKWDGIMQVRKEVSPPCYTGTHDGFFERENQADGWYHTVEQGAGVWGQPAISGYWMTDRAGSVAVLTNWCAGVKVWDVPIGWNSQIASPVAKEINPDFYKQRFEIFANGSFRIDKHANWILRTIEDHIFLNGVQKK